MKSRKGVQDMLDLHKDTQTPPPPIENRKNYHKCKANIVLCFPPIGLVLSSYPAGTNFLAPLSRTLWVMGPEERYALLQIVVK
jgi:hypothetical protein